jgi:hypothetical protein
VSKIDVTIEPPEAATPGELIKGYYTLMRSFGWDLYVTCHFALKDELGAQWYPARVSDLKRSDPKNWRPTHVYDPQDPSSILRDFVFENDSPYLNVFGGDWKKQTDAKKILTTRNVWFHFGDDPTLGMLREAAKVVRGFVSSSGLHIGPRIDNLVTRLDDLASGRYPRDPEVAAPAVEPEPETEIEIPTDLARPRIGGTWVGDIPGERYRITPTRDILHPTTMKSLSERVEGDFREKVRAWTAVPPRGGELWVDVDGAVGGYVGPTARLLGYLGPDPDGETARGFFTPHYYVADGGEVVDVDTEERWPAAFAAEVSPGTLIRVTTYGDVIAMDAGGGLARVSVVAPDTWFPGHLG